jgi:nicotinate-nucleotide pyrophosphorylase (carboxylating)
VIAVPLEQLLVFVEEDAPFGDITSDAVLAAGTCSALIRTRETGIVAGLAEAAALFDHYGVEARSCVNDGEVVDAGAVLLELEGPFHAVLLVERVALNIIGRMAGIASATARYTALARSVDPDVRIAGTRKTAPGLRRLDKKAVRLGGGDPHRFTLSDAFLIKDNHLALCTIEEGVRKARAFSAYKTIEVEVECVKDAVRAAEAGADIVMLDNMGPETVRAALDALVSIGRRDQVLVEVSGGITETTIVAYAALGVDLISIGALTHSARALDVTLEVSTPRQTD